MSEVDYVHVNNLCRQSGLLPLQVAIMERAATLFPESERIIMHLSDVYTQMPLRETKLKGVAIIENLLEIHNSQGEYLISPSSRHLNEETLGALFNAYIRMDFHERTISVCESFEKQKPELPLMSLVMRNKASAYDSLKRYEEARQTYLQLLETYYDDDSNHAFYASFLENVEEYTEAYREREIAAMLDLNDANRFTSLGVHMLNYKNVRISKSEIIRLKKSDEILNYVMPLFLHAIEISSSSEKRIEVADMLMRRNQKNYAQAILEHLPVDDTNFEKYPLEYILSANIDEVREEDERAKAKKALGE